MFESWSKNPYEDYKILTDLNELRNELNNNFFSQLFQMLKDIQKKMNDLIDYYNCVKNKSLNNLRDSVRDINVACIKALDSWKEKLNIKNIINNNNIFKNFDDYYNELKRKENENFKKRMNDFKKLDENDSKSLIEFIDKIKKVILEFLEGVANDENLNEKKIEGKNVENNNLNLHNNIGNENIIEEEEGEEKNEEEKEEKNEEEGEEKNEEKKIHNKSSKFTGVSKNGKSWRVQICFEGEKYKVGTFKNEDDAGKIYDIFSIKFHGTKAVTNFFFTKNQKEKLNELLNK